MLEVMGWTSLFAGLLMFGVIVGPCKQRCRAEKLLLWNLSISLLGVAMYWLVNAYDPRAARMTGVLVFFVMYLSRLAIGAIAVYMVAVWWMGTMPRRTHS